MLHHLATRGTTHLACTSRCIHCLGCEMYSPPCAGLVAAAALAGGCKSMCLVQHRFYLQNFTQIRILLRHRSLLSSEGDTVQCPAVSIDSELLLRHRTRHEGRCADGIQTQTQTRFVWHVFFLLLCMSTRFGCLEQTYNLPSII